MTSRQIEKIKNEILKIKRALTADKRRWGGQWHDGRGLRYLQPELYVKLQDYDGALKYFKWFDKNFPDDCGYPIFLFEWTLTLFKTGQIKEAEKKAFQTFFANTYLFDKFLNKEFLHFDKLEDCNWQSVEVTEDFNYSKDQDDLKDFADWLSQYISSEKFYKKANEFIEIEHRLKTEPVGQTRNALVNRLYELKDK